jgi:phenylpropionate dioxygenase-like ring-hydroxylating dioxygenase large terminal subunit
MTETIAAGSAAGQGDLAEQAGTGQTEIGQAGTMQAGTVQAGTGHVETGQAGTGQAGTGQGETGGLAEQAEAMADLRSTGINPDFWYPVAVSASVRQKKTFAAVFAGERIALYRGESGTVYALEDRCAHRQVPLSMGVVEGDVLRCCYHAWAHRGNGRISQIPYLPKGVGRPPRGVRGYPVREAYGLVFVFPGDPEKAATTAFPELPEFDSDRHKTMTFSRTVQCHYSFMHENLLDMNHQFLHRGILGKIQPKLLAYETGPDSVEARYLFSHAGGKKNRGANLLAAEGIGGSKSPDVITIRTGYPYQTLQLVGERRPSRVLALGGLRTRGRRAAHQPRLRPAHDRETAGPRGPQPGLAVHQAVHRARVRRGPDGGRGRAARLGRAGRGLEPRGLPADPRRPPPAAG